MEGGELYYLGGRESADWTFHLLCASGCCRALMTL